MTNVFPTFFFFFFEKLIELIERIFDTCEMKAFLVLAYSSVVQYSMYLTRVYLRADERVGPRAAFSGDHG
jgi:hypothetical protein